MDDQDKNRQFNALYEAKADAIFRYCLFRTSNRETALDMVQEAFTRFWTSLDRGQPDNSQAFLFQIAKNLIIDHYRKKKSLSLDALTENDENEYYLPKDLSAQVNAEARYAIEQIGKLDPPYRQAVYLRLVEEFTPAEIAEITGESANTISVRINRGLGKLKKMLGEQ